MIYSPKLQRYLACAGLAVLLTPVKGIPWDGPRPTNANIEPTDVLGWSPAPTNGISVHELLRRDTSSDTATNVCGYIQSDYYASLYCPSSSACAFETDMSGVGCCATSTLFSNNSYGYGGCNFFTDCYDYAQLTKCDEACSLNTNIQKCTDTAYPDCYKWAFKDVGYRYWGCTTSGFNVSVGLSFITGNATATIQGNFTTAMEIDPHFDAAQTTAAPSLSIQPGVVGSQGVCTWGCSGWDCNTATPCQSPYSCVGGYCKGATTPSTTTSISGGSTAISTGGAATQGSSSKQNTNIGAIVGGTVGGVLGLACLGTIAGLFVWRRRRADRREERQPSPEVPAAAELQPEAAVHEKESHPPEYGYAASQTKTEQPGPEEYHEAPANEVVAELPGSSAGEDKKD